MSDFEFEFKIEALEEVEDNLQDVLLIIEKLENGEHFSNVYDEMFRLVHNMKGNSKSASFSDLSHLLHLLEDKLILYRNNFELYSSEDLSTFSKCFYLLSDFVSSLKKDFNYEMNHEFITSEIEKLAINKTEPEEQSENHKYHFLVVDDDEDIIDIISSYLKQSFDCKVSYALDGKTAQELCKNNYYDLICTDYNMPHLNGIDFIKGLRETEQVNQETPIMMVTGYRPDLIPDQNMWRNVYILDKPFSFEKIQFIARCAGKFTKKVA